MATADPSSVLTRRAEPPDAVLRWADPATHGRDGLADVYLPEITGRAHQAPVVVALHGGFWRQEYDRTHLRPLAVALRALGRVVVLPEYRRGRRGGWPDIVDDVRALRTRLPGLLEAVAPGVAADPPTVLGHSAGGHLALWWALDADGAATPGRVLALAPVADLARAHADRLGAGAVAALLGGGPDAVPDAYAVADVAARLRAGERPGCPVVVLQGSDDAEVPAAGVRLAGVRLEVLAGIEHYGLIDPYSPAWPDVVAGLG
ncbi:MAG: alpha/beta hydrolase [Nocardioidaceae bacterium]|jgi:acetyl esterase/lipase|nr:alpha/beta hydrolase [Nocardioidaceae bacterium]